jgi:DNA-binding CsgD family transcriptional regulator
MPTMPVSGIIESMSSLRDRDARAVLDLVGEAHDAQDLQEFRSVVLPSVRRMVDCDYISYNEVADGRHVLAVIMEPDVEAWAYEAWGRLAGENPLIERFQRTRDGRSYRFSDVISLEAFQRRALYREMFMPLGITHQIACVLPSSASVTIGIALCRGVHDFSDEDRRLLDLARPHLAQAYRNARLRERTTGTIGALRRGLDDSDDALIVLDEVGDVAFASAAAQSLLGSTMRNWIREGDPLPEPLQTWVSQQQRQLATTPLILDGEVSVIARFIPPRRGELAVIAFEQRGRIVGRASLEEMGLTRREAEVLAAFVHGSSTGRVAQELGISPRTVHKHAQSIHAKLGVRGRSEAIAAAWSVSSDERGRVGGVASSS